MSNNLLKKIEIQPSGHIKDQPMKGGTGGLVWWETPDKLEKVSLIYLNTGEAEYAYESPNAVGRGNFTLDDPSGYFFYTVEKIKYQPPKHWTIPEHTHLH